MRGCAAEVEETRRLNELALEVMLAGQAHPTAAADRVRIAGAAFCGEDVAPVLGASAPTGPEETAGAPLSRPALGGTERRR